MCLALPAKVLSVDGDRAVVSLGGVKQAISLSLVEGVADGDYVIVHTGYALTKLDPVEAERTLALFRGDDDGATDPASAADGEKGKAAQ